MLIYHSMKPVSLVKAALLQRVYKGTCLELGTEGGGLFEGTSDVDRICVEELSLEDVEETYAKKFGSINWLKGAQFQQLLRMLSYAFRNREFQKEVVFTGLNQILLQGIGVVLGKITPEAVKIYNLARQVWAESHRVKGFIRFYPVHNHRDTMVGRAEFVHRIEDILLRYFQARYGEIRIILLRGEEAFFLEGSRVKTVPCSSLNLRYDQHEFDELWDCYYDSQVVTGRINKELARKHIPKKLWSWVPEGKKLE